MGGERVEQLSVCCSHGPLPAEDDAVDALEHESVVTKALAHDTFDPVSLDSAARTLLCDRKTEPRGVLLVGPCEHDEVRIGRPKGLVEYPPVIRRPPEP